MRGRCLLFLAMGIGLRPGGMTGQVPQTNGGAPAVSPDGSRIAFLSDRDGTTDLYVIAADGRSELRLTRTPEQESQPQWSPDGKEIWFSVFADGASRLSAIGAGGGSSRLLGTVPGRALRFSPEGKRVLYWTGTWTAMREFVSDLDGGRASQLTDGSGVVWGSRWSPDGKRIAFGDRDSKGALEVYVMNADGSGRRQVTQIPAADGGGQMPAWSPDGRALAVQAGAKDRPAHIWTVDLATGAARKLAAHDQLYQDEVPAWFPDGKRIAFQSDRTGRMEIWVMNADGSGARQVTKSEK